MRLGRIGALLGLILLAIFAVGCSGASSGPAADRGDSAGEGQGGPQAGPTSGPADPQAPGDPNQLIVYTGSMSLEVAELRPSMDQAQQIVSALGGHLAGSSLMDYEDRQAATVTYRIPSDRWTEALQRLRDVGTKVLSEETDSEDVTEQVVDLEARLANLRVTEAAFQSFMERATTIDEVLKVQRELTTVRGEIERLTAERDTLANRAALGTLSVTFEVPVAETSRASEGWDLGREIDNAVATLVRLGQGLASFAIWLLIVVVPIVVPAAVIGWIALRLRRRWLTTHPPQAPAHAMPVPPSVPPPGPWKQTD